jgi:hypothetical protein
MTRENSITTIEVFKHSKASRASKMFSTTEVTRRRETDLRDTEVIHIESTQGRTSVANGCREIVIKFRFELQEGFEPFT